MSHNLPGNPHAATIAALMPDLATMLEDPQATAQDAIGVATIQATVAAQMAIAHELRTQTLTYISGSSNPLWLLSDAEVEQLRNNIRTRLGLNGDQS